MNVILPSLASVQLPVSCGHAHVLLCRSTSTNVSHMTMIDVYGKPSTRYGAHGMHVMAACMRSRAHELVACICDVHHVSLIHPPLSQAFTPLLRAIHRSLAPHIRTLFPIWVLHQSDPSREVARAAIHAFHTAFPVQKREQVYQLSEACKHACTTRKLTRGWKYMYAHDST